MHIAIGTAWSWGRMEKKRQPVASNRPVTRGSVRFSSLSQSHCSVKLCFSLIVITCVVDILL